MKQLEKRFRAVGFGYDDCVPIEHCEWWTTYSAAHLQGETNIMIDKWWSFSVEEQHYMKVVPDEDGGSGVREPRVPLTPVLTGAATA